MQPDRSTAMQVTASELIARWIERRGIEAIFRTLGAHVSPIYDALYRSTVLRMLVEPEQGAAFMACGFARYGHKAAACVATATNRITGIANAYAERLPVLAITGETK